MGNANWVWDANSLDESGLASQPDTWMNFRRDFTLKSLPDKAEIKIAVDAKYWLYVNGEEVVWEGGLKRGPNAEDTYYDVVDIAPYLHEGENSIAIQTWYWGNTGGHHNCSGSGGLIVSTDLVDVTNNTVIETGDGRWWSIKNPASLSDTKGTSWLVAEYSTVYDATKEVDWINPNYEPSKEKGWSIARNIGEDGADPGYAGDGPWNDLVERNIPQWKDYGRKSLDFEAIEGYPSGEGQKYQAKLPYNAQMVPYIVLGEGTESEKSIVMYSDTFNRSSERITYITKDGAQEFEGKNWINGDYLYFEVPVGVELKEVGFRETGYAVEAGENTDFLGYFNSVVDESDPAVSSFTGGHTWSADEVSTDNNFYDELWKKAVRTLYVTMRDQYMDCPDRERGQYIGDAINEMEEAFYSLGTSVNALSEKAIRNICDWQFEYEKNGRTYYGMSNVRPGMLGQEINIQSLGTALGAWNLYQFTGGVDVPIDCYQELYNYLTNYDMVTEGDYAGTVKPRTLDDLYWSNLADWCDWGNNQDVAIATTAWWYISATSVRKIADIPGVNATQEQKAWMDERIASVENSFEKFWNEDLKAYATPWSTTTWGSAKELEDGSHLVDDRVNALAVAYGLVPEEHYDEMRDLFMGTDTAPAYRNASIYMEKYVIQALYLMGYDKDAMERIQSRHMSSVNKLDSTMPEFFPGDPLERIGTKNHGWSGGSMIAMSRYATGVEPTAPGYAEWHVVPQIGNFTDIDTRVPSEIGNIDVKLQNQDGMVTMQVTSPGNHAEFWVPLVEGQSAVQTSGTASYQGIRQAYGKSYAVFSTSEAGTFTFTTGVSDKDILKQVIAYAQSEAVQEEYSHVIADVQASFSTALKYAVSVDEDQYARQNEIDDAWKALMKEIHKLGFVAGDKTTLAQLIEISAEYQAEIDLYTPDTADEFVAALDVARNTLADGNALQQDVERAESDLLQAMINLRYRADKSVLEQVLSKASSIDLSAYTTESIATFNQAFADAQAIYADINAEQEAADCAAAALQGAIDNLQFVTDQQTQKEPNVQGDTNVTEIKGNAKTGDYSSISFVTVLLSLAGVGFALSKKRR